MIRPRSPRSNRTSPYPAIVRNVRDRFDFALPVIGAGSFSEPGACSTITRNRSRLPADSTLANDSVR